jgi:DNA-binding MarR family transcriptional regulator
LALTHDVMLSSPDFPDLIKAQSRRLIEASDAEARLSSAFTNQQRWLMSHIGLALYFEQAHDPQAPGLNITTFTEAMAELGIASRNTADAYCKELINYGYLVTSDSKQDRRRKPLRPMPAVFEIYRLWLLVHLDTLDKIAPANRVQRFMADPDTLARIQPMLARGLARRRGFAAIGRDFALINWLDAGAHLMDILAQSWRKDPEQPDRWICAFTPTSELAMRLAISRPHLSRKIREAEEHGAMGWTGQPGKSPLWVGRKFIDDYLLGQAVKLAVIDEASEARL